MDLDSATGVPASIGLTGLPPAFSLGITQDLDRRFEDAVVVEAVEPWKTRSVFKGCGQLGAPAPPGRTASPASG
jgi:hypothetical protein